MALNTLSVDPQLRKPLKISDLGMLHRLYDVHGWKTQETLGNGISDAHPAVTY